MCWIFLELKNIIVVENKEKEPLAQLEWNGVTVATNEATGLRFNYRRKKKHKVYFNKVCW